MRHQFCHAIDIAPTVLEALGITSPAVVAGVPQMPIHGVSLVPLFDDANARIDRGPQYFEMLGHRGIWRDGWKAVSHHKRGEPFDADRWELYHLVQDFSECDDSAARDPARLKDMIDLWWTEAHNHGVLPLDDRGAAALFRAAQRPGLPTTRSRFVYHPPVSHVIADNCPPTARGWTTTVELDHPSSGDDGALVARGSLNSGFVLYLKRGVPVFDYNDFHRHTRIAGGARLTPGRHEIGLRVDRTQDGGADVRLTVDGTPAGAGHLPRLLFIISTQGMDIGRSLSPVTADYAAPFAYTGKIVRVTFEVPRGLPAGEVEAKARTDMSRQ